MLVLSRKRNESIVINDDTTVTVVEIHGDKVRLGIVAPKEVPVHRTEVWKAIHGRGQQDAAGPTPGGEEGAGAGGAGTPARDGRRLKPSQPKTAPPVRPYQDRAPLVRPKLPENAFADL